MNKYIGIVVLTATFIAVFTIPIYNFIYKIIKSRKPKEENYKKELGILRSEIHHKSLGIKDFAICNSVTKEMADEALKKLVSYELYEHTKWQRDEYYKTATHYEQLKVDFFAMQEIVNRKNKLINMLKDKGKI